MRDVAAELDLPGTRKISAAILHYVAGNVAAPFTCSLEIDLEDLLAEDRRSSFQGFQRIANLRE